MDYTYRIRRLEPRQGFMSVVYSADDKPDIYQNFNPTDFTAVSLTALITDRAQWVVEQWYTLTDDPLEIPPELSMVGRGAALPRKYTEPPLYDPRVQGLEVSWLAQGDVLVQQWQIFDLPPDEIAMNIERRDQAQLQATTTLQRSVDLLARKLLDLDALSPDEAEQVPGVFELWMPGMVISEQDVLDRRVLRFEGRLYRVLQAHTTAAHWLPDAAVSLYALFRDATEGPSLWKQPSGAHDAYARGDRVIHDNPNAGGASWIYESVIESNTTEPGRDGTFDRYWTPVTSV